MVARPRSPSPKSVVDLKDTTVANFWGIEQSEMPVLTGDEHARDCALRIIFDAYAGSYGKRGGGKWERKYEYKGMACFGAKSPDARGRGALVREHAALHEMSLRRALKAGQGFRHSKFARRASAEAQLDGTQFAKLVRETGMLFLRRGILSLTAADVDLIYLKARDRRPPTKASTLPLAGARPDPPRPATTDPPLPSHRQPAPRRRARTTSTPSQARP